MRQLRWGPLVIAFAVYGASPAFAQDDGAEAPLPVPAPSDDGPGFSRVVDDEETIYAIQRKAFLLTGKLELSAMYNNLVGDRFVTTENSFAFAGSVAYHVSEAFAVEAFGGYFFPTVSETISEITGEQLAVEPAKRTELLWAAGLGVQWSPVYGKLQFAGATLGNFAFYLGVGGAFGRSRVPTNIEEEQVEYTESRSHLIGVLSAGFRFRFLNWLGLKIELKDYIFPSQADLRDEPSFMNEQFDYTDSVRNNIYLQIGLSFLLGGESN